MMKRNFFGEFLLSSGTMVQEPVMGSKLNRPQTSRLVGSKAPKENIQIPAIIRHMFLVVYNLG